MGIVYGVDGCKTGWIAVSKDIESGNISWRVYRTATELIFSEPTPQVIAIDIPVGLPNRGARDCDTEARHLLGPGRGSSVFPAPIRPILGATSYEDASQRRFQVEQKHLSIQAWAIIRKINEVDEILHRDPALQARVREVHPEVCFHFLNGKIPLQDNKKSKAGHEQRKQLLESVFGKSVGLALAERNRGGASKDDILDAFVALWTAERIALGVSQTIPFAPRQDSFGLNMEMVI